MSACDVPAPLVTLLAGCVLEPIGLGESGATVWRCGGSALGPLYLKTAPVARDLGIDHEAARLRWLRSAGIPSPRVHASGIADGIEYMVMDAAEGLPASDAYWSDAATAVATALGTTLARLHRVDIASCPFDRRTRVQLDDAQRNVALGLVDEDDFDHARKGRTAGDLLQELLAFPRTVDDLVVGHGDFCLPNVILQRDTAGALQCTGLIDCGRLGVADRHQDLALAIRSITFNFGAEHVTAFLDAYGHSPVDATRIEFFTLLDELF